MNAYRSACGVALATWLAGCSAGGTTLPPDPGPAYTVSVVSGNNQIAIVNTLLPVALHVKVTNADGVPMRGMSVTWRVNIGGGSVPSPSTTDSTGQSQAPFTLGGFEGFQTVTATVASSVSDGEFSAFAHLPYAVRGKGDCRAAAGSDGNACLGASVP